MKNFQSKALCLVTTAALLSSCLPMAAKADSSKVVTLGTNLSDEQKNSMYEYFGTNANEVETIEVTNQDERKYMEGIASEAQIGKKTFSCSYVEPTEDGGIQVKVANLTFVTSSMIASTLLTSGVENCNVVAASPIEVSGTGALTGIMMAYESASGEELSEEQKAAATEELVTTGELADDMGQDTASNLMNDVKQEVIEKDLTDESEIKSTVEDAADKYDVNLSDEQIAKITALMQNIAQYDYDVKALKETLDNLEGKEEGFFSKLMSSITGFFGGGDDKGGIINSTNDSILGDSAVIDSTLDDVKGKISSDEGDGFFDKIANFFKGLFGGNETDDTEDSENSNAESVNPQNNEDDVLPEDDPEDPENPNNISKQRAEEAADAEDSTGEDTSEEGQTDTQDNSDNSDISE